MMGIRGPRLLAFREGKSHLSNNNSRLSVIRQVKSRYGRCPVTQTRSSLRLCFDYFGSQAAAK